MFVVIAMLTAHTHRHTCVLFFFIVIEKNLNFQEHSKYIYIFLLAVYMYFLIVKLEMMQSKTSVDAHGLKVIHRVRAGVDPGA